MTNYLIAPTEPPLLKALGNVSGIPELRGADVLFYVEKVGLVGVQRKTVDDLIASINDGRIASGLAKMQSLAMALLIVEGRPRWSMEGALLHSYARFSREQFRSFLRSVQLRGVLVDYSDDLADTVVLIESIQRWVSKGKHDSLDRRPKPKARAANWGHIESQEWAQHLLQSVPSIGPAQAKAIWDHFGGLPVRLTVSKKELLEVRGVGEKVAAKIIAAFNGKAGDL
jgi:ERCC4-type nuclease